MHIHHDKSIIGELRGLELVLSTQAHGSNVIDTKIKPFPILVDLRHCSPNDFETYSDGPSFLGNGKQMPGLYYFRPKDGKEPLFLEHRGGGGTSRGEYQFNFDFYADAEEILSLTKYILSSADLNGNINPSSFFLGLPPKGWEAKITNLAFVAPVQYGDNTKSHDFVDFEIFRKLRRPSKLKITPSRVKEFKNGSLITLEGYEYSPLETLE